MGRMQVRWEWKGDCKFQEGLLVRIARKGQGRNRKIGKDEGQAYSEGRKKKWWVEVKRSGDRENGGTGKGKEVGNVTGASGWQS